MTFTKTIGNLDPWTMPSDGTPYVHIDPQTKKWERRQYHRAGRRNAKQVIDRELSDYQFHPT